MRAILVAFLLTVASVASVETVQQQLARYDKLDVACRGGFSSDQATDKACEAREALGKRILHRGYCFNDPGSGFHRC